MADDKKLIVLHIPSGILADDAKPELRARLRWPSGAGWRRNLDNFDNRYLLDAYDRVYHEDPAWWAEDHRLLKLGPRRTVRAPIQDPETGDWKIVYPPPRWEKPR